MMKKTFTTMVIAMFKGSTIPKNARSKDVKIKVKGTRYEDLIDRPFKR